MFTGIIQTIGHIDAVKQMGDDVQISVQAVNLALNEVKVGDSIAVNGACLTVAQRDSTHFTAHVSKQTLDATTGLNSEQAVNLEKAMRLSDRLGGHLVSGHVDGVGEVMQFTNLGDCWLLAVRAPHAISKYIAKKGSVCIDGVSLTVNKIEQDTFEMNIIPHTLQSTTLNNLCARSLVNIEVDQIARYVERMAEWAKT